MKTVVITGGTGFLGLGLLKTFQENGVNVYALVRKNSLRVNRLKEFNNITVIEVDFTQSFELPKEVYGADALFHLAWEGKRDDYYGQIKNIPLAVNVLEAAHKANIKQFIVTGSQAEYGIKRNQISEDTPSSPNTAYGVCKLATYQILQGLSKQLNIPLLWVRVFSVYGEYDNPNTLISYLLTCFREGKTPQLTSGKQLWDFLHIDDASKALFMLAELKQSGLFNLASGESRPLREYIEEVRDIISPQSSLSFEQEFNEDNIVQLNVSISKIQKIMNWRPEVSFREGITRLGRANK